MDPRSRDGQQVAGHAADRRDSTAARSCSTGTPKVVMILFVRSSSRSRPSGVPVVDVPVAVRDRLAQRQPEHLACPAGVNRAVEVPDRRRRCPRGVGSAGGQRVRPERLGDPGEHRVQVDADTAQRLGVFLGEPGRRRFGVARAGELGADRVVTSSQAAVSTGYAFGLRWSSRGQQQVAGADHRGRAGPLGLFPGAQDAFAGRRGEPSRHLVLPAVGLFGREDAAGVLLVHGLSAHVEGLGDVLPGPALGGERWRPGGPPASRRAGAGPARARSPWRGSAPTGGAGAGGGGSVMRQP